MENLVIVGFVEKQHEAKLWRGAAKRLEGQPSTSDCHEKAKIISDEGVSQLLINTFVKSLYCSDHHLTRTGDELERLVTASPVMTKSRALAGGSNYPDNGLVKPPRRDTRALSPAGVLGGKALLRLAEQKSRSHAPSAPTRSAPA